jgi:CheY-like chemotaxis protein
VSIAVELTGSSRGAAKRPDDLPEREQQAESQLSHQLRGSLNSIMGFAQLLLRGVGSPLTEQQRQLVEPILRSGHHLLSVLQANEPSPSTGATVPLPRIVATAPETDARARTLLCIDYDSTHLALLEASFADEPRVNVLTARTMEAGIEAATKCRPDVVLTDLDLPDGRGSDLLERLRSSDETREVPVIALTATPPELAPRAGEFDYYLTKPVALVELEGALNAVLLLT